MELSVHRRLTRNAVQPQALWSRARCCDDGETDDFRPRRIIYKANEGQDNPLTGQNHNEYHVDNGAIDKARQYIRGQWKVVRTWDAMVLCCECEIMTGALEAFGRLLHGIQDFYSHTAWVELNRDNPDMPLWDPEGTDDVPVTSGSWPLGSEAGPEGAPSHGELNKDSPDSAQGGRVIPDGPNRGKTLHQLAVEYAQAATNAAYQLFRQRAPRTVDCIENRRDDPCAGCAKEDVGLLVPPAGKALVAQAPGGFLDPSAVEALVTRAAAAVAGGAEVPTDVRTSLTFLRVSDLIDLARDSFTLMCTAELESGALGALNYGRAVVLLDALGRVAPHEASSLVRSIYTDSIPRDVKGLLLAAGSRLPSREMRGFFAGLLLDESRVARDIRAFELAASALEDWLDEEFEPDELETPGARARLYRRLSSKKAGRS
jgi:hypothetical protein